MKAYLVDLIVILALIGIAFGTIWTAYESHVANIGVMAWQHEFEQIRQPDSTPDNNSAPQAAPLDRDTESPQHSL